MGRITDTVKTLLILNVIFFVASNFLGANISNLLYTRLSFFFPKSDFFIFWQPLTHMFMHAPYQKGSLPYHIIFNMFNLYIFGSVIENSLGRNKFLFIYFSAGLGALALHLSIDYFQYYKVFDSLIAKDIPAEDVINYLNNSSLVNKSIMGASGAVWGLMVAFAYLYPNLPLSLMFIPVPIKSKLSLIHI